MSIDSNLPPAAQKPAVRMQTRTQALMISTPAPGNGHYRFTAVRERFFFDEDGTKVDAPAGAVGDYRFSFEITPEALAENPELAPLIRGIAAFVDKVDPGPHAG